MPEVDLTPNAGTAVAAQRGLDWLKEGYGGDGLVDATISDARKMAAREALSEAKVRKMPAWFARHEVDLSAPANSDSDDKAYPGPGAVAWALWGGDAGRSWSEAKLKELEADAERAMHDIEEPMLEEPMIEDPEEVDLANSLKSLETDLTALHMNLLTIIEKAQEEEVEEPEDDSSEEPTAQPQTALEQPVEAIPAAPTRSGSLTVEKRDGLTLSLRSAAGTLREVKLPETRSMLAPISVEAETKDDQAPVFRGHAAVFDEESQDLGGFTEVIARGAFRRALTESQDTVALFNHDSNLVLGRTTNRTLELKEDPRGLHAEFNAPDTQYARDIRELVKRGDVHQMSFSFTVLRDDWQERTDGTVLRRVLEVDRLYDVSLVTTPAYTQTTAEAVRDLNLTDDSELISEPSSDAAEPEELAHDPREAELLELQSGANRRMTLANAKHRQNG
jgi:HK97 family phage prohead protease